MDAYVMPTNDTDYSCHIAKSHRTYLTNHTGSISHHITPLVINGLRMDTHANTHAYKPSWTEAILRNQACASHRPAHACFKIMERDNLANCVANGLCKMITLNS